MSSKIIKRTESYLHDKAEPVDFNEKEELLRIIGLLKKKMKDNPKAQGFAANQMGFNKSIAICRYRGKEEIIINPCVIWEKGHKKSLEGCLSISGRYNVKRPLICKVYYFNENGEPLTKILFYKKARIYCHEIDHLKGICISDKGVYWKWTKYAEELMKKESAK